MEQQQDLSQPKTPSEYLQIFLTGLAMGMADLVPGVSGGTMAFILGVYENLIDGIKSFNLTAIRLALKFDFKGLFEHIPFRFLIALGLGIMLAFIALSGILSSLLEGETSRIFLFAFFFGLVIASIIAVGQKVRWSMIPYIMFLVGAIVAFVIVNVVPAEGSHDPLTMFISGAIAICAMILPGISGSFILLILGQYDYVLTSISDRNIEPLIFVALGCVVGIIIFSRVLSWTLKRYYDATVALLVGFMAGSLWKIYPWKDCIDNDFDRHGDFRCLQEVNLVPPFDSNFFIAMALLLAGFLLVSFLDHMQSQNNMFFRQFFRRRKNA
ncbi:MAG: DUF368 domain-containing protein [Aggregatilineales bacterium]